MKIKAVVHQAEEGGYWAEVPAFPGCYTQAENMEELIHNLKEVISLHEDDEPNLSDSNSQVIEIII